MSLRADISWAVSGTPSKRRGMGSSGVSTLFMRDPMNSTVDWRFRICSCAAAASSASVGSDCERGSGGWDFEYGARDEERG